MRLTNILCVYKKKQPCGHRWHGKHRLYKIVKPKDLDCKKLEFQMEEKNMFFLRHPYMTVEQQGFLKKPTEHEIKVAKLRSMVWAEHLYLADRLGYLKINDNWEK